MKTLKTIIRIPYKLALFPIIYIDWTVYLIRNRKCIESINFRILFKRADDIIEFFDAVFSIVFIILTFGMFHKPKKKKNER